jgi:metallo-beta-lactamase family protein
MKATIGFYGGTGSVTGANFLLDTGEQKILIDCGLVQGSAFAGRENEAAFSYDPKDVAVLFVTHAHADHIGRIPKLIKDGFAGVIYSTPPTHDLAAVMLRDAYEVMTFEAKSRGTSIIYDRADIDRALERWETIPYGETKDLGGGITATLSNAGHILGSSFVTFARDGKKLLFTGDIGNAPQPLLDDPEYPTDADFMVMESVYGDRNHEDREDRRAILLRTIKDTVGRGGTLIIPAFSLERTQAILFEINNFVERKELNPVPTFLDSPLAIEVTEIYRKHKAYLKKEVREQIDAGDDIFAFPKLSFTRTAADSAEIRKTGGPKIIIAGSGMSHGGRIRMHEREYLDDPKTTLLLVGHQTVGSVGRLLHDGAKKVVIDKEMVRVRARVERIQGYSGHADRDALVSFVERTAQKVKRVFVAMGEEKASLFLVQRLRDFLGVDAVAPLAGSVVEIEW